MKGRGSGLRDAGNTLGATYGARSGGERPVQVILSLITWEYMSNICTLEAFFFLLKQAQKIRLNLKCHCHKSTEISCIVVSEVCLKGQFIPKSKIHIFFLLPVVQCINLDSFGNVCLLSNIMVLNVALLVVLTAPQKYI